MQVAVWLRVEHDLGLTVLQCDRVLTEEHSNEGIFFQNPVPKAQFTVCLGQCDPSKAKAESPAE